MSGSKGLARREDFYEPTVKAGEGSRISYPDTDHNFESMPEHTQPSLAESFGSVAVGDSRSCNHKATMKPIVTETATSYPPYLVNFFGIGLIGIAVGIVGLVLGSTAPTNVSSLFILTVGAIVVALTLLRGQEIDERV
jgi:hypothetical protein